MVKMHHKNLLVLGLIPSELEHLKNGQPLHISLDDLGLAGQLVVIIPGDNHEELKKACEDAEKRLQSNRSKILLPPGVKAH